MSMSVPLWEECVWASQSPEVVGDIQNQAVEDAVFQINQQINSKIYLHLGSGYKIPCNACVIGQNEQLDDHSEDNAAVFTLAGPTLETELAVHAPIQTGESVITTGGTLPCEWLIHAVGPRYDNRYLTASDHALFSAYKSSLFLAAEKEASDVVLTCVYSRRKKYPRFDAAHVALRTVRKFLEHGIGDVIQRIMFCVPTQEDYDIYSTLLCAYFPRNSVELACQSNLLPSELGDEWGELVLPDRVLKVSVGPKPLPKESLVEYRRTSFTDALGGSVDGMDQAIKSKIKTG
jgi:O-acetyl-ADP-ribose deacetylase (regulator of RNase III)